jgi:SUMO ligase MMS21 Smc5/6 complex component
VKLVFDYDIYFFKLKNKIHDCYAKISSYQLNKVEDMNREAFTILNELTAQKQKIMMEKESLENELIVMNKFDNHLIFF